MSILDKTILFMAPVKPEMHFRRKKILITPHPNHLRALFFFFSLFFSFSASAQSTLDSLIDWVNTHPHNDSIRVHKLHRISYMLSETDVSRAFEYYKKVEAISDSMNFTFGKAIAQVNLGILLTSSGNFESSTNAYFKAIDLAKACNANRVEAVCLNNIGENFASQKDFDKCRRYALMALDINRRLKAARGVAINYELIARCDFEQRDYTDSRKNLDIGMTWARQANENYIYSQFYLGYGKLMAVENQTDSAKYFFDKAIASARVLGSLRKPPSTADVIVNAPGFLTPRSVIQVCSASMTTITPTGASLSKSVCAICCVKRSWTCKRRANISAMRASFDKPIIRPPFGM